MYVPRHFATDELTALRELLALAPLVQLISLTTDGLVASALPMLVFEDGDRILLHGHLARANDHWKRVDDQVASLVIVSGPDTYVSPNNYATKARTHEVVPTWNYEAVHVTGTMTVHDDPEWVLDLVSRLTNHHEQGRPDAWKVSDAPADYIKTRLRGIVGIELAVDKIEAKAKLSQDKAADDVAGVRAGLAQGTLQDQAVASRMAQHSPRS